MQEPVDQELVRRVQNGDKKAFDILVLRYQHRLVQLISRYIKDSGEVMDIAQESFIKAYRALPKFRGDSEFYTWLYRIAINTAKNYLVSRSRRALENGIDIQDAEHFEHAGRLKDHASPEHILLRDEIAETVAGAIDDLPDELRIAISLREFEGMSYEAIARTMGCPVGTVRSRIFRAREAIDKKIASLLD